MKRFAIAAAVLSSIFLLAAGDPPAKPVGPLFEIAGSYSGVKEQRVEVIGDAARWGQVWKSHMGYRVEKAADGSEVVPYIDFSRCMIVAMFSGPTMNSTGLHVVSAQERDGHTLIRFDESGFQSMTIEGKDPGPDCTSYGFAVLDRSSLPMIREQNTQSLIGGAPIWTERLRLPALPKAAAPTIPRSVR